MDEPLSNLDAQLRLQMRIEIKRLQRELGVTTLYVTHDQVEAMTMADMVAVMHDGRLQQLATPADLYAHPANLFVARFCGSPPMNVLDGRRHRRRRSRTPPGTVAAARTRPSAAPVKLGLPARARDQIVDARRGRARCAGEVYVVEPLGNETLITVQLGDELVNLRAAAGVDPAVGTPCRRLCPTAPPAPVRRRHRARSRGAPSRRSPSTSDASTPVQPPRRRSVA